MVGPGTRDSCLLPPRSEGANAQLVGDAFFWVNPLLDMYLFLIRFYRCLFLFFGMLGFFVCFALFCWFGLVGLWSFACLCVACIFLLVCFI